MAKQTYRKKTTKRRVKIQTVKKCANCGKLVKGK